MGPRTADPLLDWAFRVHRFKWREGMIVNDGKLKLLDSQDTYLAGLKWGLFATNVTILATTVFGDLTEAAWTGYARVTVGTVPASTIVAGKATTQPNTQPSFGNSSGSTQTFFGWFLLDATATKLVAAVNLGSTTLASGATYPLAAVFTDDEA
jgi:hypothetical protein